jgi:hypothetical protein
MEMLTNSLSHSKYARPTGVSDLCQNIPPKKIHSSRIEPTASTGIDYIIIIITILPIHHNILYL